MSAVRALPAVLSRTARLIPWWHLALGLTVAFALASTRRIGPWTNADDMVFGLRVAAVALAAGAAFVFDDPALNVTDGKPIPLWLQRTGRLVLVLPAVVVGWWTLTWWMHNGVEEGLSPAAMAALLPGLWIEMLTLIGVVWAVATIVSRTGRDSGGIVAAPALLAVVLILLMLPEPWTMFPSPADPPFVTGEVSPQWQLWIDAHRRWLGLGAVAWATLVVGLSDPRRTAPRWRTHRRTATPAMEGRR